MSSEAPPKAKRPPTGSIILVLLLAVLMVRGLWRRDTLWRCVISDESGSLLVSTSGLASSRLGLGFFYDHRLISQQDLAAARDAAESLAAGWTWSSTDLPERPSLLASLGFSWTRQSDQEPGKLETGSVRGPNVRAGTFHQAFELMIPVWLLAALFAIAPARYLLARRRERVAQENVTSEKTPGARMRIGIVIGLLFGLLLGGAVALFIGRHGSSGSGNPAGVAADSSAAEKPIHPIVGTWRINIAPPIAATYRFDNDGSFALSFKGVPGPGLSGAPNHEATGTWKVNGDTLLMTNKTSTTPLTVVGEEESARVVSINQDKLVLANVDRRGKPENLTFERYAPFVAGKSDNAALVGIWQGPAYVMELKSGGDVQILTRQSERGGKWSQQGKTLRLLMDPPPVRSAARRAANPQLTQSSEQIYEFSLAADNDTLTVRRTDQGQGSPPQTFQRTTADRRPHPQMERSRK